MTAAQQLAILEARRMAALEAGDTATFAALASEATPLLERLDAEAPERKAPRRSPKRSFAAAVESWRSR